MTLWRMGQGRHTGDQSEHTTLFFTSRKAQQGIDSTWPRLLKFILSERTRAFETVVCLDPSGPSGRRQFRFKQLVRWFDGRVAPPGLCQLVSNMLRLLSFWAVERALLPCFRRSAPSHRSGMRTRADVPRLTRCRTPPAGNGMWANDVSVLPMPRIASPPTAITRLPPRRPGQRSTSAPDRSPGTPADGPHHRTRRSGGLWARS